MGEIYSFNDIIGTSDEINRVKNYAKKVAKSSSSIFIFGETGTGKEMIAQAIHNESNRCEKPFIAQNCAAIPENLLESIFFGTSKGSFTGAIEAQGLFEAAHGGSLYLDELNSMDISFQGKLLRVIQEGELRRLGESKAKKVDVRIIASVSENPEILIKTNKLRKDLYYRLNVVRIDLPTLNNRRNDIPLLIKFFINKLNTKCNTEIEGISTQALDLIMKKNYEGNVRELEHLIEGAIVIKQRGIIEVEDLNINNSFNMSLKEKLEKVEKRYIKEALIIFNCNITKASEFLDIPRQTLQYKIRKYNINIDEFKSN